MKDGQDIKKTVEELADKVKTDGATSETIAKEAEFVMNNQVNMNLSKITNFSLENPIVSPKDGPFSFLRTVLLMPFKSSSFADRLISQVVRFQLLFVL